MVLGVADSSTYSSALSPPAATGYIYSHNVIGVYIIVFVIQRLTFEAAVTTIASSVSHPSRIISCR